MKGLFITFEGPDGAGKTTQLKRLVEWMRRKGMDPVVTREPGGTEIGDRIREILLSPDNTAMADRTEVLLYAASRAQHVREKIVPALEAGRVVVCDRFIDASVAYQAYGLGMGEQEVRAISRFAAAGLEPDRTYLLDIPAEVGRSRLLQREGAKTEGLDRIEQRELDYHRRVREGFQAIAAENPGRVRLIDANRGEDEIAVDIAADFRTVARV